MQPKTIKSEDNNIFENGRRPQSFIKWKTTSTKIMQSQIIRSKNNDCGTAPGNLVYCPISNKFPALGHFTQELHKCLAQKYCKHVLHTSIAHKYSLNVFIFSEKQSVFEWTGDFGVVEINRD